MIKVKVNKNIITVMGHADYEEYGKDIVCAAVSAITTTSVNACLKLNKNSITYESDNGRVVIIIKEKDKYTLCVIQNMIDMLKELACTYKKNIQIEEERL